MKYLILLIVSASALSNLPDEINYYPYEQNYNQISNDLDDSNSSLELQKEDLSQIIKSISYTQNSIYEIENQIQNDRDELQRLQNLLPILIQDRRQLQNEMATIDSRIQNQSIKAQKLQGQLRDAKDLLRPVTNKYNRQALVIENIKKNIASSKREEQNTNTKLKSLNDQIKSLRDINKNLSASIVKYKADKAAANDILQSLKAKLSAITKQIADKKANIAKIDERIKNIQEKIVNKKAELEKLIANGATKDVIVSKRNEIRQLTTKLQDAKSNKKKNMLAISSLKVQKNNTELALKKKQAYIANIPGLIQSSKTKIEQNRKSITQKTQAKDGFLVSINKIEKQIEKLIADKAIEKKKLNRISEQLLSVENLIKNLREQKRIIAQKLTRNQTRYSEMVNSSRNLTNRINTTNTQIPSVANNIQVNLGNLDDSNQSLANLRSDEEIKRIEISQTQSRIINLENQKSIAYNEFRSRKNLYASYDDEASVLGDSQTNNAITIGQNTGAELANSLSLKNANSLSNEVGEVKAKLIGTTRGENQGYSIGYNEGVNSSTSVDEGQAQGQRDAEVNSYQYAQTILKPKFFEEFYQAALNENIVYVETQKMDFLKSFEMFEKIASILPLSQNEIDQSTKLNTSLDSKIEGLRASERELLTKLNNYKLASFSYIAPMNAPFKNVDCSNVYKGLKVFVDTCSESYRNNFSQKFYDNTKSSFSNMYPSLFSGLYEDKLQVVIDSNYQTNYDVAYKVAFSESKVIGKKDAYDRSYSQSYESNYQRLLPVESSKAKLEAKSESVNWISSNAAVTVKSIKFDNQLLKGSDKANIILELKNVSMIKSINPGSIKFVTSKNIVLEKETFMLPDVEGRSSVTMIIPFSVNNNASSNDYIEFKAQVLLPKDKYKQTRVEDHSLSQKLIKNPKFNLTLDYNKTPKVKGLRSYYVHSLDFKLISVVESIYKGYTVTLEPQGNASSYLRIKNNNTKTGSTNLNIENKTSIKYVFNKNARKRKLSFKAIVKYEGVELSSQIIEITPR